MLLKSILDCYCSKLTIQNEGNHPISIREDAALLVHWKAAEGNAVILICLFAGKYLGKRVEEPSPEKKGLLELSKIHVQLTQSDYLASQG